MAEDMADRLYSGGSAFRRGSSWASSYEDDMIHKALGKFACRCGHGRSLACTMALLSEDELEGTRVLQLSRM